MRWLDRLLCRHTWQKKCEHQVGGGRTYLKCITCGKETPGMSLHWKRLSFRTLTQDLEDKARQEWRKRFTA